MAGEDGRVGLEGCRRGDAERNVWRADGEVAHRRHRHSRTPRVYIRAAYGSEFRSRGARMLPAVSSETGIPDGPAALDEMVDGGDPRARIRSTKTRRG